MPPDVREPTDRQRALIAALTAGGRTSLNRCWRHIHGSNHHPSLGQLLASPSIVRLLAEAVAEGRPLPRAFEKPIMRALRQAGRIEGDAELMALR